MYKDYDNYRTYENDDLKMTIYQPAPHLKLSIP